MGEFWEDSFVEKQMMWGAEPADSAIEAKNFFLKNKAKEILIPGIGYGRNAKIFIDNGIEVTGIEISQTAIDLARENGIDIPIYHGSVTDMPFDDKLYDGIFCYALIHLLDKEQRAKLIEACYNQLKPNGYMIFTSVSKKAPMYGKGKRLSEDWFETMHGVRLFFYDVDSIKEEFGKYNLVEASEIDEPNKERSGNHSINFMVIKCKK
jgi:SAM-dependent methyltransferase